MQKNGPTLNKVVQRYESRDEWIHFRETESRGSCCQNVKLLKNIFMKIANNLICIFFKQYTRFQDYRRLQVLFIIDFLLNFCFTEQICSKKHSNGEQKINYTKKILLRHHKVF